MNAIRRVLDNPDGTPHCLQAQYGLRELVGAVGDGRGWSRTVADGRGEGRNNCLSRWDASLKLASHRMRPRWPRDDAAAMAA